MSKEYETLFPEAKVGDIIIKPWSFGMLFKISDVLGSIIDKAEKRNILQDFEKETTTYVLMAKLFSLAGPELLSIISLTINMSQSEVEAFDMATGIKIALIIFNQNKDMIMNSIKNVFSVSLEEKEEAQE